MIIGKKGQGKTTLVRQNLNNTLQNIVVVDVSAEYQQVGLTNIYNLNTLKEILEKNKFFKINYNFTDEKDIDKLIQILMQKGDMLIIFDEAHRVIKEKSIDLLIRYSRRLEINIIFVSHRIYDIPPILRSQLDMLCIFRMQEIRDIEYLEKFLYSFDTKSLRLLQKFQYIEYNVVNDNFLKKELDF